MAPALTRNFIVCVLTAVAVGLLTASCASDAVSMEKDFDAYERAWEADKRHVVEWEKLHRRKFLESNPSVSHFEIGMPRNVYHGFTFSIDGKISDWEHLEPLFSTLRTAYILFMETMDDPGGLQSMTDNSELCLGWGDTPQEYADLSFLKKTRIASISFGDNAALKSLAGIEDGALKEAYIKAGDITDYSPLQRTGIETLTLENAAHLSDLKTIARMDKLEILELRGSGVTDLSALSGNDTIEYLIIGDSPVTDLTPVASLKKLKHLALRNVPVSTLDAVTANDALEIVLIVRTSIKDLSPLTKLPHLKHIRLSVNEVNGMTIPEALKSRVRLFGSLTEKEKPR